MIAIPVKANSTYRFEVSMSINPKGVHRTAIPIDYIASDPNGNRRSRRLATKVAKATEQGRSTSTSTGGSPIVTDNRNEKRNARKIQQELGLPYVMALRLLREETVEVRDGIVIDNRRSK